MLDEEECYLAAILDDPSGIELAEFCWIDDTPGKDDPCFRVWDFQWTWYNHTETYQIDQAGRSLGKSMGILMRAFAFPFNYPGQEMLITAPELNHLGPIVDKVEDKFLTIRLGREMLPRQKGGGIKHQPQFQLSALNGAVIMGRLPGRDGKGVKGQHPLVLESDEMQDYPRQGWMELIETMKATVPGAQWRAHGVSRGVRDEYFRMTENKNPDLPWYVHRYMAMHRPSWADAERRAKIAIYGGSRDNPDYKRNIYGEHGDASNSVFVLSRLMACVDTDEGSEYNTEVYAHVQLEFERLPTGPGITDDIRQAALLSMISLPGTHHAGYSQKVGNKEVGAPKGYSAYWGGADIGVTNHPSEFLIFGQRTGTDELELLTRINLQRINTDDQKVVVEYLFDFYGSKLKVFALDKTGVGFPIWDQLSRYPKIGDRIRGYNFSEKVPVAFEDRPLQRNEKQEDLAIWRNVVEATTDFLRNDYVDAKRLRLPYDREILLEFQGQTYSVIRDTGNPYGQRRLFGGGSFHTLDAAKMVMAGKVLPPIAAMLEQQQQRGPVLDVFVGA